jgi:hypothetical protein
MQEAEKAAVGPTGMRGVDLVLFRLGGLVLAAGGLGMVIFAMAEENSRAFWIATLIPLGWIMCAYASRKT